MAATAFILNLPAVKCCATSSTTTGASGPCLEVRECLEEAGFSSSVVYMQDEDVPEEGYEQVETIDGYDTWLCYMVGVK